MVNCIGSHPTNFEGSPASGTNSISFFCDDIEATVAELKRRGADFGYGRAIHFKVPGDFLLKLFKPHDRKG